MIRAVAGWPVSAHALDPDERQRVAVLSDSQPDPLSRHEGGAVEDRRRAANGHHLHGPHAKTGHRLMTHEEEVGSGAGDDLTTHFVGGRADDRAPQRSGKDDDEQDEEDDEEPARAGAPAQRGTAIAPIRRRGCPRRA
jgi:hypothetical protein